ncbi:TniQ family protein [Nonomuraea sp. NPDC050022]|uniref:TniQ family protein n=1 Tax=unclassified Nonomuraea TaxID=2593643 RepID=UPI0033E46AD3
MSGGGARRWPLHPPPHPGEALSSWLQRLASRYELTVAQLLTHNRRAAQPTAAGSSTAPTSSWG